MAKRTKKNDGDQKNKKGFDSAVINSEFSHEFGSAAANKIHKEKAKKEKASKNAGKYKGGL
ncbi:hypothetical protein [Priestia megaterium]|uniref:hypothetical protein n=1 Tax=Priestia megaterium TaxID=1404 RepID=UPI0015F41FC7|nr:hypothetical protein [Priestia megaterium]MEB4860158.1 hypothetical protein [Priestia megaterium]